MCNEHISFSHKTVQCVTVYVMDSIRVDQIILV